MTKVTGHNKTAIKSAASSLPASPPAAASIVVVKARKRPAAAVIIKTAQKPEWQMTAIEKMNLARGGVSKRYLEELKRKANLDYEKLSTLLGTTRATLINKKGAEHFSATLSERIVGLTDLYSYGFEVFENEAAFNEWVSTGNKALGGKRPFELLDNQFGREEVKNLVGRIQYGVYS